MRKIYCRRLFLPLFILSIVSLSFLILTTIVHNRQNNFASYIYNNYPSACTEQAEPVIVDDKFRTVPSNYLVVPYREFALRTTISCRAFKLDNPGKNPARFHPKYSKYLRGAFPHIIPEVNITFDDIEDFYTNILTKKKRANAPIDLPFAQNIIFENVPYNFEDGMWKPKGVVSAQRTALLIPLQGRDYNAKAFIFNMHAFLRRQQLTYTIILIEQISPANPQFNKGRLYNTAVHYLEKQDLNITCIILHDVDLLPENDGNFYTCENTHIKHTTSRVRQLNNTNGYIRYYEFLIGGVLLLKSDMYRNLNGFSNLYWGWGGEDDDLALRLVQKRMCVVRPDFEVAIYAGLPHPRGARNNARFRLLSWTTLRMDSDGLEQIEPLTRVVFERRTSIVTHLRVDVDANGSLNAKTTKQLPSPSNSKDKKS